MAIKSGKVYKIRNNGYTKILLVYRNMSAFPVFVYLVGHYLIQDVTTPAYCEYVKRYTLRCREEIESRIRDIANENIT